ncbi:ribonuclease E/G [Peptoniphilus sp. KCTC 25270]|uniref:ribonuclease E/G n=1 Tax=Peptoniphilus sp. KCTC 25270 TaxID=2897414 RepID=UPI001E4444DE|nr:ribonuclease E/G [Peptoniphilus sp. KCTC 25270]MCD1146916.1 ribonuclease E/G [Peptoniphilus sp. KCTC 25270]
MDKKFDYKNSNFFFIDCEYPELIGQIEEGKLVKIDLKDNNSIVGNIYRAQVTQLVERLDCAFVNIGEKHNGYLPRRFFRKHWLGREIKQGDTVFVEVKKPGMDEKGPLVTMEYSIRSENLVYIPSGKGIKVSNKIANRKEKDRLISWLKGKEFSGGMILRTDSKNATYQELEEDYSYVMKQEEKYIRERNFLPVPKLLFSKSGYEMFLQNLDGKSLVVNEKKLYRKLKSLNIENILLDEEFSIRGIPYFREQFDRLFSRTIHLENGSNIVIEDTEALTVVDVNTSHAKEEFNFEEYIYRTNQEAASEIARQILLRGIGGMIAIDFIRMKSEEHKKEIYSRMDSILSLDETQKNLFGFSNMGLFEISVQRNKERFVLRYNEAKKNRNIYEKSL